MDIKEEYEKLLALRKELLGYIEHWEKEYKLSRKEIAGILSIELISAHPYFLENHSNFLYVEVGSYFLGDLFSFCGDGAYSHFCNKRTPNGLKRKFAYGCKYHVVTPSIPKENEKINFGFLFCKRPFAELRFGIIGQGIDLNKFCDVPFRETCTLNQYVEKVKPVSPQNFFASLKNYLKGKNPNYARYGEKVFKIFDSLARELHTQEINILLEILGLRSDKEARQYRV